MKLASAIFSCFLVGLLFVGSTAPAASLNPESSEYTEIVSGDYKLSPKSAWLDAKMMPVVYSHVHWFIEVNRMSKTEPVRFDQPVKRRPVWENIRKVALKKMIDKNLLSKEEPKSSGAPLEFYRPKQFDYLMQQALSYRLGSDVKFCKARLVIRAKKITPRGDLRWMEEIIINLPSGNGC